MDFIHYQFTTSSPNAVIGVEVDRQANVRLLDSTNFARYRNGRQYRYQGGLASLSPFWLHPPHPGHWHVVIDLGGARGQLRHKAWVRE